MHACLYYTHTVSYEFQTVLCYVRFCFKPRLQEVSRTKPVHLKCEKVTWLKNALYIGFFSAVCCFFFYSASVTFTRLSVLEQEFLALLSLTCSSHSRGSDRYHLHWLHVTQLCPAWRRSPGDCCLLIMSLSIWCGRFLFYVGDCLNWPLCYQLLMDKLCVIAKSMKSTWLCCNVQLYLTVIAATFKTNLRKWRFVLWNELPFKSWCCQGCVWFEWSQKVLLLLIILPQSAIC